jgi:predicted nucleotidyltransferase
MLQKSGRVAKTKTGAKLLLANAVAARYGNLPQVEAVALGGSLAAGTADAGSDIDLYVYLNAEISVEARAAIAKTAAEHAEVNNQFWEPGDEWIDAKTDIHVDVMFRAVTWIEEQLDRVLRRCEASVGYTTCFWYNVITSQVLYDRAGWFQKLQREATRPYPEELRRAIVAKNHPILRRTISSYKHQLERAIGRNDGVSVNHRVAALLASYFDILFAVNRMPHPGEKRLVDIALKQCEKVPARMKRQLNELLGAVPSGKRIVQNAEALIDGLDDLLKTEGFST